MYLIHVNQSKVAVEPTVLFTHLFYAFLQVDNSTFQLTVTDDDDRMLRGFSSAAHGHSPRLQALLSIGGGNSSSLFATLAADPSSRAAFIQSTIAVARQYDLDGLDLDWEYPLNAEEMANFGRLVTEWRAAVAADSGGPRLLLTAAVYFEPSIQWAVPRSYPVAEMASALDWINSMAYDLHGRWELTTGLHAALYDPTGAGVSGSDGVSAWVDAGMPAAKVALGMPLYGHTWQLTDPNQHGVGAPAAGEGPGMEGELRYSEVVPFNQDNGATVIHDVDWGEAYSYAGTIWVGYDDAWTAARKVEYVRRAGIGGDFFWYIGQDDAAWTVTTAAWNA